ncbi:MAG TPA: hypothetical protein ENI07_07270 [Desulfobacterales bacterium]|nr:hypothetical protein [Desulfobacterales bacterium]
MNGYIYILTHSRMPGLVKIGLTTTTVAQRVTEINASAGVPGKFKEFCSFLVSDPERIESVVHRKLRAFRLVTSKEFFELKPSVAKQYVGQIIEEAEFGVKFDPTEMTLLSDPKRLGEVIRGHRKRKRMRQSDLAAKVGTGLRFIIEVEQGKPTAQIGKVLSVLTALGVRIAIDSPEKST